MHFHPALGDPEGLHERERGLFESEGFAPAPRDCKAPAQSFTDFLEAFPSYPTPPRTICYLETLPRVSDALGFSAIMEEFLEVFFGWPVRGLPWPSRGQSGPRPLESFAGSSRQVWASDMFQRMKRTLPQDAYCLVTLAYVDLYPEPSMIFLFSQRASPPADLFSFFRVDAMHHENFPKHGWPACAKALAHELCHLLGLAHCCYFRCLMNPCAESSTTSAAALPLTSENAFSLCPICLRKLAYACSLDIRSRYQKMAGLLDRLGCAADAEWVRARLSKTPGAFPIEWSP